ADRERNEMRALKQRYATGKSRSEHPEHRAMAQIGKAASPTRPVTPASQSGIRVARPQPRERQRNRNEQETARQRSGTPVERLDQKIKRRGKQERTQGRGRLNYTDGQPPFLCVVMLRAGGRNDE